MAISKSPDALSAWSKGFMHAIVHRCIEKMAIVTRKEGRRFLPARKSRGPPRRFTVKKMAQVAFHEWNLSPNAAIALQSQLASRVIRTDQLKGEVRRVAGVDMAINEESGMARAAVVLLSYPELEILERHVYEEPVRMEYNPGLLSFRGKPGILGAFSHLHEQPDPGMGDRPGFAHP